uniref:Endothelial cells scavenger receptor n=1 Tax=Magallana gigas TaxID=29159 RepID=K1PR48_MAGGI
MAVANARHSVFLMLLSVANVSSYLQFVVPGVTQANSSSVYDFEGTYYCWPNRTVDGNINQSIRNCLHTGTTDVTEAWLRIDLQRMRSVKSVKFWYRNDRGDSATNTIRLKGYSIRGTNTTAQSSITHVCYTDTGATTLPTIIEVVMRGFMEKTAPKAARTVRIVQCATLIQGNVMNWDVLFLKIRHQIALVVNLDFMERRAPKRVTTVGIVKHVTKTRANVTVSDVFFQDTNHLLEHNGFHLFFPSLYSACPGGLYGQYCSKSCGNCLQNTTCNHGNGTCLDGCDAGYKGKYCTTPCSNGEYGGNCIHKCSENCGNGEVCDKVHGHCASCMPGFQGLQCDEIKQQVNSEPFAFNRNSWTR